MSLGMYPERTSRSRNPSIVDLNLHEYTKKKDCVIPLRSSYSNKMNYRNSKKNKKFEKKIKNNKKNLKITKKTKNKI